MVTHLIVIYNKEGEVIKIVMFYRYKNRKSKELRVRDMDKVIKFWFDELEEILQHEKIKEKMSKKCMNS